MRLIDVDKLLEVLNKKSVPFNANVNDAILTAPTVNAVEVVRCKDCKYFEPDLIPIPYFEGDGVCCHEHWKSEEVGFEVKEIDFCSYGERK